MKSKEELNLAVYGSLRYGLYNYTRFMHGLELVSQEGRIYGYNLYDLGPYPCIVKSSEEKDFVIVDVIRTTNIAIRESINGMELMAGYNLDSAIVKHPVSKDEKCLIYTFKMPPSGAVKIESGDWSKHSGKEKPVKKEVQPDDTFILPDFHVRPVAEIRGQARVLNDYNDYLENREQHDEAFIMYGNAAQQEDQGDQQGEGA